jgi:hypothetical protein
LYIGFRRKGKAGDVHRPPRQRETHHVKEPIRKITLQDGTVRYRLVVDVARGADGKRRQVTHTYATKKEAQNALANIRVESSTGRYVKPGKTTLGEYLDRWLPASSRGLEPGTVRSYQDALRVPRELLGHRSLQSLDATDITGVVDHMLTNGRKKGGPVGTGLGPRSVQMTLIVLRRAFRDAVRDRKMAWNPGRGGTSTKAVPAQGDAMVG